MFIHVYSGKQMSRTVSARIPTQLHEDLRERCNITGESISDFIEAAIRLALGEMVDFNFGEEEIEELERQKMDFKKNSENS